MSIDRAQLLTDVRTIFDAATGDIATLRDAGAIRWEGPFDAPDATGDAAAPAEALDVLISEVGAGGDTFGVQMLEFWIEVGVWIERKFGHMARSAALVTAVEGLFEGKDSATMQFYPWEAYVSNEGDVGGFYFKALQLRGERREAI